MFCNYIFVYILSIFIFLNSCGRFNPINDKIDSTSDGSYAIETELSDRELLEYGMIVLYRFQSIPNLVAVRQSGNFNVRNQAKFSANYLNEIIEKNKKLRPEFKPGLIHNPEKHCHSAYCEAHFDKANIFIKNNHINLKPIQIAVIDSGVLASTVAIKKILYASSNISGDMKVENWQSHATMISSVFAGIISVGKTHPENIYASNALIDSIKITFSGDDDKTVQQKYGSMQLAVALDKAVAEGSKIVNLSLTYTKKPDDNIALIEKAIISAAAEKGVIFVAAAGNESVNIDSNNIFPASYDLNNLVVVGSHTSYLNKADTSNFGKTVDISAQGASISVNDKYGNVNIVGGTSFAAPLVASALSLYLGAHDNAALSVKEVLNDLFNSASKDYKSEPDLIISNYGRLDTEELLNLAIYKHL